MELSIQQEEDGGGDAAELRIKWSQVCFFLVQSFFGGLV